MRLTYVGVGLLLLLPAARASGLQTQGPTDFGRRYAALVAARGREADSVRLRRLFELRWEYLMTEFPEFATQVGYPGQNDRWTDNSLEAIARHKRELEDPLKVLRTIDRARLAAADQLNYDLFRRNLDEAIEQARYRGELMPVNQRGGVQQDAPRLIALMPASTVRQYEDIVSRLEALPALVDQSITLMDRGLAEGLTPPRITLRDVPQQVQDQLVDDPLASPMLRAFTQVPASVPLAEQERLRAGAVRAYAARVAPAFRRLYEYLVGTYIPRCRESVALRDLPNGAAWYAFRARQSTTTDLTPEQIHALGLAEVKRIRARMDSVIAATGFTGSFAEFAQFLRTDPRFFFDDAEGLLRAYRDIAKRADPELAHLFGRLPRLPYGVIPVPSYAERSQTTAYYQPGADRKSTRLNSSHRL